MADDTDGAARSGSPELTADGHHVVINGRRWRATDPLVPDDVAAAWRSELMAARRGVQTATKAGDEDAVRTARSRVQRAKVALGERGTPWWEQSLTESDPLAPARRQRDMMAAVPTVQDCERVQTSWYRARCLATGGNVWEDDGLLWSDGPDGLNLMFPTTLNPEAVRRGLGHARAEGRGIVGAWLDLDVDASCLADAGFERGWSPWWMTASLAEEPAATDPRIRLERDSDDYQDEDPGYRDSLALARQEPVRAWYAAAHLEDGRFAGRAWSLRDGNLAGVFDMAVWPAFRRRGLGTRLLSAVCAAARADGAEHAVLNATPEGKKLYETCGFQQIGEGITWWHHLGNR